MVPNQINKLIDKKINYLEIEPEHLDHLVLRIRQAGEAKDEFRKLFYTNALLFMNNRANKVIYGRAGESYTVPIIYWFEKTDRFAELITEILIKTIEKGTLDIDDENVKSKKINVAGYLWKKMNYIFIDLVKDKTNKYCSYFDEDIPYEKKFLDFLEEISIAENDPFISKKIEALKKKAIKEIKKWVIGTNFYRFLRDKTQEEHLISTESIEKVLLQEINNKNFKEIIIDCIKSLTLKQKLVYSLTSIGFMQKDIAEIMDIKPPAVHDLFNRARTNLLDCIEKKRTGTITSS